MKAKYLFLAATAAVFAACSSEEKVDNSGPVEAHVTAGMSGIGTRAVNNLWNTDSIGIMVDQTNDGSTNTMKETYRNVGYCTISTGSLAEFDPISEYGTGIFFEDAYEDYTFNAYAPYQETSGYSVLPGTNGEIDFSTDKQETETKQEKIDFLFASGATASKSSPEISFTNDASTGGTDKSFKHKMSRLIINVQVSNTDGFDSEDVLTNADYQLNGLVHDGFFNVLSGDAMADPNGTAQDWTLRTTTFDGTGYTHTDNCVVTSENGVVTFTMILAPQYLAEPLTIKISPNDGEFQEYVNNTTIKPELDAGMSYTYTITAKKTGMTISGCEITNWTSVDGGDGTANME